MSSEKKQAELIKEISGVNPLKCMKCGKCSASCPAYEEMALTLREMQNGIAEIKAVLDGREYILDVPEGDHFLICTEVAPTTEDNHCDFEKLAFYNGSGEDITAQIP